MTVLEGSPAMPGLEKADAQARLLLIRNSADAAAFLAPKSGIAYVGSIAISPLHRKFARLPPGIRLCLVNPKGGPEAWGMPVYPSVRDLPDEFDVVVIKTAAIVVPSVLDDCAARGIRHIIVFSSGFSETGPEGAVLQRRLTAQAGRLGVRFIGPNTNDNTYWDLPIPGGYRGRLIALITQSGAGGRPVLEGTSLGAAVKRWVATGNEADLEVSDFVEHFTTDEDVGAIALYLEGFQSIAKLRVALEHAQQRGKPIVLLKMGATERGSRMTVSHTGHLAGRRRKDRRTAAPVWRRSGAGYR